MWCTTSPRASDPVPRNRSTRASGPVSSANGVWIASSIAAAIAASGSSPSCGWTTSSTGARPPVRATGWPASEPMTVRSVSCRSARAPSAVPSATGSRCPPSRPQKNRLYAGVPGWSCSRIHSRCWAKESGAAPARPRRRGMVPSCAGVVSPARHRASSASFVAERPCSVGVVTTGSGRVWPRARPRARPGGRTARSAPVRASRRPRGRPATCADHG